MNGNSTRTNQAVAASNNLEITLDDTDLPVINRNSVDKTGWLKDHTPLTHSVQASDPGLGMFGAILQIPNKNGGVDGLSEAGTCTGGHVSQCAGTITKDFSYSTSTMPEGINQVQVIAVDLLGKRKDAFPAVKVDRTAPELDVDGTLKPDGTEWVASGPQDLAVDAEDPVSGVRRLELRVDGQLVDFADCATDGCSISDDFEVNTSGYSEGEHTATVIARDAAGNETTESWEIGLERTAPTLVLSGPLRLAAGQRLNAGQTYELSASATDQLGLAQQSGLGSVEVTVDGNDPDVAEDECPLGACGLSRSWDYVVDDYSTGQHTITVTATDLAGNKRSESFTVENPDEGPAECTATSPPLSVPGLLELTPDAAVSLMRLTAPQALQRSSSFPILGRTLNPGLMETTSEFTATGGLSEADLAKQAGAPKATVHTFSDPNCLVPTTISDKASQPQLVDGTAAFYANTASGTDTAIRATGTGIARVLQIRDPSAPTQFSWHVALAAGQQLKRLSNGSVAIVEPSEEPGAPPPSLSDPLPASPSASDRERALWDTALQLSQSSDDLERAQATTSDDVIAVIPEPYARDSTGQQVPASLTATGSTMTIQISHSATQSYPVVSGQSYVTSDAVNDYELLKAAEEVPDAEWDEEPTATDSDAGDGPGPGPSPPAAASATSDDTAEEADGFASASDDEDIPVVDVGGLTTDGPDGPTAVGPVAASAQSTWVGLTTGHPTVLADPWLSEQAPRAVRPLVPWRVVQMRDDPRSDKDRRRASDWGQWFAKAKAQSRKLDVTFETDYKVGRGATPLRSAKQYRSHINKFLRDYGGGAGVVNNVMAWNEPQYQGKDASDKGDPLKRRPQRAAAVWVEAKAACRSRCGRFRYDSAAGRWELVRRGNVVAGEFVGRPGPAKKEKVRVRVGRRIVKKYYNDAYRDYLLDRIGRRRMPQIWSVHAYSDLKAYLLNRGSKTRDDTRVMERYHDREFARDDYEYVDGSGNRRKPRIWVTAIGAPYHLSCGSVSSRKPKGTNKKSPRDKYCGGATSRVLAFGMALQRNTAAFLLRKVARYYPRIDRVYYFNLRSEYVPRQYNPRCVRPEPAETTWVQVPARRVRSRGRRR